MRKLNTRKIVLLFVLAGLFSLGLIIQYYYQHSKASAELEQLNKEINLAKENNKQLEREIINLHKEIEKSAEEESPITDDVDSNINSTEDKINTADTTNTVEDETTKLSSDEENEKQQGTSDLESAQDQAINLVKDHINYTNESNVHFEVQGKISGTEDLSIHVYEVVVDEGESQHTATWGWYGVNVTTGKVYEING
ncbi:hypothetical protein [Bacillus sp. D386]|uniref:hypothetical protein n=1 Tax=Bacillus sp. D386 TaxID=2587155 RepID=UPI001124788D|nr:hypothetical protein [Bacillus sp. D386]